MSASLVRTYVDTIRDLARGQPVKVAIPHVGIVEAQPSVVEGPHGEELVQLDIQTRFAKVGAMEAQIRMSPETFKASLQIAANAAPRLEAVNHRALRRLGGG